MPFTKLFWNSFVYLMHAIWLGLFPSLLAYFTDIGLINQVIQLIGSIFATVSSGIALYLAINSFRKHYKLEKTRKKRINNKDYKK